MFGKIEYISIDINNLMKARINKDNVCKYIGIQENERLYNIYVYIKIWVVHSTFIECAVIYKHCYC